MSDEERWREGGSVRGARVSIYGGEGGGRWCELGGDPNLPALTCHGDFVLPCGVHTSARLEPASMEMEKNLARGGIGPWWLLHRGGCIKP